MSSLKRQILREFDLGTVREDLMLRRQTFLLGLAFFATGFLTSELVRRPASSAWPAMTQTALAQPVPQSAEPSADQTRTPVVQLRIYTINRGKLDEFVSAWREGVYRLRLEQGYEIPAAWKIEETNQFVWIVRYDGAESWEEKEAAYYGSAARHSLDPDPRQWIARPEGWFVTPVLP